MATGLGPAVGPTAPQVSQPGSASTNACQGQLGHCPLEAKDPTQL